VKSYMDQLAMLENVPRKEKQFRNFTVNSLRLKGPHGEQVKSEIWALIVKVKEEANNTKKEVGERKEQPKQIPKEDEVDASDRSTKTTSDAAVSESDDEPSKDASTDLPSEKAVTKAMKKALKRAPNGQLKFKALRKRVQESLSFEIGKSGKKKWKKLLRECVDANPKKLLLNGKNVTLTK
jgi:hypothetical protein